MEAIEEVEMSSISKSGMGIKPNIASLEVLDHVKINIEPETPISTLKIILTSSSDLSFTKDELRKAQDLMTNAFVQFHKNLRVLKSYW